MRFEELSEDGQVALAAWAVLLISETPTDLRKELRDAVSAGVLPSDEMEAKPHILDGITRAMGDLCAVIGFRHKKKLRHNNQRRNDLNPRNIRKKVRAPKRRPSKRKVTA